MRKMFSIVAALLAFTVCFSNTCDAAYTVKVISDSANKKHWSDELAKFAEQLRKLQQQIDNQAEMINKKALDLMSHNLGDLTGGNEFISMMKSINSIHDSINAIGNDYTRTVDQWTKLMPDYRDWKNLSVEDMARQTAKTRDAWERALQQGLIVAGNHGPKERTATQEALVKAMRLSNESKGSVQSLQALAQLNAINAAQVQRLNSQIAESNRMLALTEMRKLDEEKKREQYLAEDMQASKANIDSLNSLGNKHKPSSGKTISRK